MSVRLTCSARSSRDTTRATSSASDMKRKMMRYGCLSGVLYCVAMVLTMHFVVREGFFGVVNAFSTLHGGNPGYRRWHGQLLDDITAPVQLPILYGLVACQWVADRVVPSRRAEVAFQEARRQYALKLESDFDHCLDEVESVVLTNAAVREAWATHARAMSRSAQNNIRLDVKRRLVALSLLRPEYMEAFYPFWYDERWGVDERLKAIDVIAKAKEGYHARSAVYAVLQPDSMPDSQLELIAEKYAGHIKEAASRILTERGSRKKRQQD